jgi:tetratricopeptide (TPR) repeat protein
MFSSIISHNENKILDEIYKYLKEYEKEKSVKNIKLLCNAYYNYCFYGYSTEKVREKFINKALSILNENLKLEIEYADLYFLAGKFYIMKGMYEAAEEAFSYFMYLKETNPASLSYLAEIYFYKKEYKNMKELLEWIKNEESINERIKEVIDFWES